MDKSESKYRRTAEKMDNALIHLLGKKDLEFITVKEICDLAEVNRSTFYLHYQTIGDILDECFEYVFHSFNSYFVRDGVSMTAPDPSSEKLENLILITPEYLKPYLNFIQDNQSLFAAAIKHPERMNSFKYFETMSGKYLYPILSRFQVSEKTGRYMLSFYINGIIGIISEWIKGGCTDDIDELISVILQCVKADRR